MIGSAVPSVLASLVTLWRAANVVTVIDGPAYDPPNNFLAVGWDRTDQPSVQGTASVDSLVGAAGIESFEVSSLLSFEVDTNEVTTGRALLFTAFHSLSAALSADPTLGGTVMQAAISNYDLTPVLTEAGSVLDLRFSTAVQAWG